ncbi:hydantoinase/oxoprolinase family protein [Uliginosibacterium sediminicola]|uniref:Hydantoinase/oxoprolinase family protein n=1 Tax=Uliginosibacterium sediminicola TaxID=2024550 RepID=A0ABU9Z298_9RHOO
MSSAALARIGADIGGTFTDVVLETAAQRYSTKVLTTYDAPERALLEGVQILLAEAGLQPADVGLIVHGTTLATNALIERRGVKTAMLTTDGFRDVLDMGSESRFDQYDITMEKPPVLVPRKLRISVPERIAADGAELQPLDEQAVRSAAASFAAEGVESIAVAFLHSYANPAHEQRAAQILREALPEVMVSLSSEVSPEMREYERFTTTAANAYVQPLVANYLRRLENKITALGFNCPLFLMLSSGGLTTVDIAARFPVRLVESGPAGGALFAASIAAERNIQHMLALDVGGTTAKICYIDDGRPQSSQVFEVARVHRFRKGSGLPLRIPVVEMVEIGAGGGSIASVDGAGRWQVGPHSAGSEPGPACYGRGGTKPTVTDADLALGRIDPAAFAGGSLALDLQACDKALLSLPGMSGADAPTRALGISEIVDEAMTSAARVHAVELGLSLEGRTLVAFGGCAPLHAARIAEKLGIDEVVIPRSAGVGSAVGFLRAPIAYEIARSKHQRLDQLDLAAVNALLQSMADDARQIVDAGAAGQPRQERRLAFARYCGQGYELPIELPTRDLLADDAGLLIARFEEAYRQQYGGFLVKLPIEILSWRVSVSTVTAAPQALAEPATQRLATPAGYRAVRDPASGNIQDFAIHHRERLSPGDLIQGPALVIERETTSVISPSFDARIDRHGYIVLRRRGTAAEQGALHE